MQTAYVLEADGTGGSGQRGIEQLTRLKMQAYENAVTQFTPELLLLSQSIKAQDSIIANVHATQEQQRRQYATLTASNIGFLERNKAMSDLSAKEPSVFWSSLFISLLIILIEIGPILSKLIMPVGPYDIALAKEELTQMAAHENDMRKDKEIVFERKKNIYQKQKEVSDQLVERMTNLQQKHIDEELDKWERGEWNHKDHRASMDEVLKKIKQQYRFGEDDLL